MVRPVADAQRSADQAPPPNFSDWGACPFECCTYRQWTVDKPTAIYRDRSTTSAVVFRVRKGDRVTGMTGVVITIKPGKAAIRKDTTLGEGTRKIHVKAGDTLYLLHYEGEGFFKFWFRGKTYDREMLFPPDNPVGKSILTDGTASDIETISDPETVWWVKVKNRAGQVGWTRQAEHFGNMDSCG